MQVRPKVAWWWAWLLPSGWIFALQASSFATDGFSATPALAAIVFAMRGGRERRVSDLWLSILSIGLLTGTKQTTLPLMLVWIVPMLRAASILLKNIPGTIAAIVVGLAASALPITILNLHYSGNWKGLTPGVFAWEQSNPIWGLIGNAFMVVLQSFQPPLFPWAPAWNALMYRFVRTPTGHPFLAFEYFGHLGRSPTELNASLGLGISCLMVATLFVLAKHRRREAKKETPVNWSMRGMRWFPFLAAAVFLSKSALAEPTRYIAPYYPFFLPAFLSVPFNSALVRQRWWRRIVYASVALTIGILLISRQRPILPAYWISTQLVNRFPNSAFLQKVYRSFAFSHADEPAIALLRDAIPPDATVVGYAAVRANLEYVLWRTGPVRKVHRFNPSDDLERARRLGITYIFVDSSYWGEDAGKTAPASETIDKFVARFPGQVIGRVGLSAMPDWPPDYSYLVKLDPPK
jgi:hypothetical protein